MSVQHNRRKTDKNRSMPDGKALGLLLGGLAAFSVGGALLSSILFIGAESDVFRSAVFAGALVAALVAAPLLVALHLRQRELGLLRRQITQATSQDQLTSCISGAVFPQLVDAHRARRGAFLVVDADHLRTINERFGFRWGDEALRVIAEAIRDSVRAGDLVGRLGGEEFGVFLREASLEEARKVAERIQAVLARTIFEPSGTASQLSVTVGGVVFEHQIEFDHLVRAAVQQMEHAKQRGEGETELGPIAGSPPNNGPMHPN